MYTSDLGVDLWKVGTIIVYVSYNIGTRHVWRSLHYTGACTERRNISHPSSSQCSQVRYHLRAHRSRMPRGGGEERRGEERRGAARRDATRLVFASNSAFVICIPDRCLAALVRWFGRSVAVAGDLEREPHTHRRRSHFRVITTWP